MQIPEHWAEARVEGWVDGKKRVVRRYGWSDIAAEDAQQQAEQRAAEALACTRPMASAPRRLRATTMMPVREPTDTTACSIVPAVDAVSPSPESLRRS